MSPLQRWVWLANRRSGLLVAILALAGALGLWGTSRLYGDLRPDLKELLPAAARSAIDLETVTARVGGFGELNLILAGPDPLALELAADDLAEKLEAAPPGLVKWVEYRVDEAADFFKPRLLLFPEKAELERLRDALRARIAWEEGSRRGGAQGPAPDVEGVIRSIAGDRAELLGRFRDGYTMGDVPGRSPGQKTTILAMIVRLAGSAGDHAQVLALDRLVRGAVAELDLPRSYPGVEVGYGGYVSSSILEHRALEEDLVWATLLVVVSVAAAVAIYNRTWKAVPAVGIPLLAGTFVTFGLAELAIGHLNANTAFLGSIVVGNGINVGLIFFARYLEDRRHGKDPFPAMTSAVENTWVATLTAALSAGVAYASLLATDFRGFNQFGLIGGLGMALSWVFSYAMTPPLVLLWERLSPLVRPGERPARPLFTRAVSAAIEAWPRATATGAALLTAAAAVFIWRFARDPIEHDFRKLRDQTALLEGGPGFWDDRVDALFGDHLTPTVLLARDEAEAREIARRLEAHRRAHLSTTTFGKVISVGSLVPEGQAEKLPIVREIATLATRENLAFLPPDKRMAVEQVLPPADLAPFGSADLPPSVKRQLTELDGRVGTPVLLHPSGRMDVWNGKDVVRFAAELRSIPLPRADVPMASSTLVFADVLAALERDGPRATALSLAGVVALVLVAFGAGRRSMRSLADAGWVLAALGVGVVWFLGLAGFFGARLNMLNFIALPITFGIGVDYSVNVFQRRRLEHARSIADVIRTTGGAVALCSLTTIIGYSSLLIARNQALVSFGWLAVLGEVACLAAALLALPAFLRLRELRTGSRERARVDVQPEA